MLEGPLPLTLSGCVAGGLPWERDLSFAHLQPFLDQREEAAPADAMGARRTLKGEQGMGQGGGRGGVG